MDKAERAMDLVETLAMRMTPEEEFEKWKNEDGIVMNDGVIYEDVDEMISDMSDDSLLDEYAAFMDFVRAAKEIFPKEKEDD